jgi:hypothetical protein
MAAGTGIPYPTTSIATALWIFFSVVLGVIAINILTVRLSTQKFDRLATANAWVGPVMGIILVSATLTLGFCPAPLVFWASLEFATLGIGAFLGLVLALNAGKDGSAADAAAGTPKQAALTNLGVLADWVTKTLLGATLVNIKDLGAWLWSACRDSSMTLYGRPEAAPSILTFGGAFFIIGLLMGLLVVRMHLSNYFESLAPNETAVIP